jgi:hypothetical protein
MTPFGKFILYTKMVWAYDNGDAIGFVFRWWHPLVWIVAPLVFILAVLMHGFPETWHNREDLGFRITPFIKKKMDEGKYTGEIYKWY